MNINSFYIELRLKKALAAPTRDKVQVQCEEFEFQIVLEEEKTAGKIWCVCEDVSKGNLSDMGCNRFPVLLKVSIINEGKKKRLTE